MGHSECRILYVAEKQGQCGTAYMLDDVWAEAVHTSLVVVAFVLR
jgi:hypothetical protein